MTMKDYSIFHSGDQAITISFGNAISVENHQKVLSIKKWFDEHPFPGLLDIVIAYNSVTVVYDAYIASQQFDLKPASRAVRELAVRACQATAISEEDNHTVVRIPVCYEAPYAPDMQEVMALSGLSEKEIIQLHTSVTYLVFMIGFLPGFPYMGPVSEQIRIPRKDKPAPLVKAGSVGVAGFQTGIYSVDSPGGWRIIGATPLRMFDKDAERPSALEAGERIEFYPISEREFRDFNDQRK